MRAYWLVVNSLIGDVVEVVKSPDVTVSPDNGPGSRNVTWENRKKDSPWGWSARCDGPTRPMVSGFPVWIRWQSHNGPD
jgi:hypothetical protein